jgi:hypothetical protein
MVFDLQIQDHILGQHGFKKLVQVEDPFPGEFLSFPETNVQFPQERHI